MATSTNDGMRVLVDVHSVHESIDPIYHRCWCFVAFSKIKSITDLGKLIRKNFQISRRVVFDILLDGYPVLPDEPVRVLRDGDILIVRKVDTINRKRKREGSLEVAAPRRAQRLADGSSSKLDCQKEKAKKRKKVCTNFENERGKHKKINAVCQREIDKKQTEDSPVKEDVVFNHKRSPAEKAKKTAVRINERAASVTSCVDNKTHAAPNNESTVSVNNFRNVVNTETIIPAHFSNELNDNELVSSVRKLQVESVNCDSSSAEVQKQTVPVSPNNDEDLFKKPYPRKRVRIRRRRKKVNREQSLVANVITYTPPAPNPAKTDWSKLPEHHIRFEESPERVRPCVRLLSSEDDLEREVNVNGQPEDTLDPMEAYQEPAADIVENGFEKSGGDIVKTDPRADEETKDYSSFEALVGAARIGDQIAFQELELSENYTPEISKYREAKVIEVMTQPGQIRVKFLKPLRVKIAGKFSIEDDDGEEFELVTEKILHLSQLHNPKLLPSG